MSNENDSCQKHTENLMKLCRLCCKLLKKKHYLAQKYKDQIEKVFFINITHDEAHIHPPGMCHKCYLLMRTSLDRESTNGLEVFKAWTPHDDIDCTICKIAKTLRSGVIGLQTFKKTKENRDRPQMGVQKWSQILLNELGATAECQTLHRNISIEDFSVSINTHLSMCKCEICFGILRRPVIIKKCEHLLCFTCFGNYVKNKNVKETFCLICKTNFEICDVQYSSNTQKLLLLLQLNCKKCDKIFNAFSEYDLYKAHLEKCVSISSSINTSNSSSTGSKNSSMTISDVFELSKDDDIPRELEDAALHVIKNKMAKSKLPNKTIEFKSGGPWVCINMIFYKIFFFRFFRYYNYKQESRRQYS